MSFPKEEKITSRRAIELLLKKGRKEKIDFIQVNYLIFNKERTPSIKVLFAVPKRKFSRAVDRNLIKRRMREAYRMNKFDLVRCSKSNNLSMDIMFIYIDDSIMSFGEIEYKIVLFLEGLKAINEINS